MESKVCKRCGKTHPIEFYDWTNKQKGYRKTYCRDCSKEIYKQWKLDNKAKHDEWFDKYYNDNPEMFGKTGGKVGRPMNENELKSGVYVITNTETGETYVGCSNDVKRRIWRHFYNRGRSKIKLLSKAIKTYGKDAFTAEVLEYCPKEQKFEREDYWLTKYGCEYNTKKVKK